MSEWTKERHEDATRDHARNLRAYAEGATPGAVWIERIGDMLAKIEALTAECDKERAIGAAWKAHSRAGQRMWTAQQAHDIPGVRKAVEDIENASEDLRVLGVDPDAENAR